MGGFYDLPTWQPKRFIRIQIYPANAIPPQIRRWQRRRLSQSKTPVCRKIYIWRIAHAHTRILWGAYMAGRLTPQSSGSKLNVSIRACRLFMCHFSRHWPINFLCLRNGYISRRSLRAVRLMRMILCSRTCASLSALRTSIFPLFGKHYRSDDLDFRIGPSSSLNPISTMYANDSHFTELQYSVSNFRFGKINLKLAPYKCFFDGNRRTEKWENCKFCWQIPRIPGRNTALAITGATKVSRILQTFQFTSQMLSQ